MVSIVVLFVVVVLVVQVVLKVVVICEVQGTRSRIWAGIWAQNPVLKIAPPGGPAGWDKLHLPGGFRRPCYTAASVAVAAPGRICSLAAWLA